MTAQIVSAHVANNTVEPASVPALIHQVFGALSHTDAPVLVPEPLQPAVPVKKSVFADYLVCLEDGKKLKMLKRHLQTSYDLTPQQYRERWNLPRDYPMVAPNYAERRSALAKKIGLGRKPGAVVESGAKPPPASAAKARAAAAPAAAAKPGAAAKPAKGRRKAAAPGPASDTLL